MKRAVLCVLLCRCRNGALGAEKGAKSESRGESAGGRMWGEQIKQINRMARVPSDLLPGYFISSKLFRPLYVPLQPLCVRVSLSFEWMENEKFSLPTPENVKLVFIWWWLCERGFNCIYLLFLLSFPPTPAADWVGKQTKFLPLDVQWMLRWLFSPKKNDMMRVNATFNLVVARRTNSYFHLAIHHQRHGERKRGIFAITTW